MTLNQFLSGLKTSNILVIIKDNNDNEIAKVYASSYEALDDSISIRTITKWYINGSTNITVVLDDEIISA